MVLAVIDGFSVNLRLYKTVYMTDGEIKYSVEPIMRKRILHNLKLRFPENTTY